ncbi:E3 SUMO-protein ligase ZNF451 isoform X2 [Lissotriton helveticus]
MEASNPSGCEPKNLKVEAKVAKELKVESKERTDLKVEAEEPTHKEDEIEFVSEAVSRPVLDFIDLVDSDDEEPSCSQVVRKVKSKDYIDRQKDRVASTLDRLARHVEVEKKEQEARNRKFLERKDSLHAHGLQELEFIKGHEGTEEARRCVDHWVKMPGLRPGSVTTGRRRLPIAQQSPQNNKPVTCPITYCNRKFDNGHLLLGHLKRFDHSPCDPTVTLHGTPSNSYACVVCCRRFTTQQEYTDHLLMKKSGERTDGHSNNPPPLVIQCFACPSCFLLFNIRDECLKHMSADNHFVHRFKLKDEKGVAVPVPFPSYAKKILISLCKDVSFQVRCTACRRVMRSDVEVTAHFRTQCREAGAAAVSQKTIAQVAEIFLVKAHCLPCKMLFSSDEQVCQHKKSTNHNPKLITKLQESVLVFCYVNEGVLDPSDVRLSVGRSNQNSSMLKRAFDHLGSKNESLKVNNMKRKSQASGGLLKLENMIVTKTVWFCECNQKFETDQVAEKHILSANSICYKCMVCGKRSEESTVIQLHMSRFHGGAHLKNYYFWCNTCNAELSRKENALAHIAECHSGHTYYYDQEAEEEPPSSSSKMLAQPSSEPKLSASPPSPVRGKWECSICEELFDSEESVQQHCKSLGSHQFHKVCCDLCKLSYHKVERFYRHCQEQHNGEIKMKYVCGLCEDLFFDAEEEFLVHYTNVHSREYVFLPDQAEVSMKDQETIPSTPEDTARLTCGCLTVYTNKNHRKDDLVKCKDNLLAKGSMWYSCSMCKATGQKEADIMEHFCFKHKERSGRVSFEVKCGTCTKSFDDMDGAQQHYHACHSFLQKPNLSHPFGSTVPKDGVFTFTASSTCTAKQLASKVSSHPRHVESSIRPCSSMSTTESSSSSDTSRGSESTSTGTELPDLDYLRTMTHIVFVDLDNWATFFNRLPGQLNQGTFVWGFQESLGYSDLMNQHGVYAGIMLQNVLQFTGGNTNWRPPEKCPVFNHLENIGSFFLHPRCSNRKDAADFAICMHAGRMDEQLPKQIPFTILSGDKGFLELESQFNKTLRPARVLNPHHIDGELMCALLNSIADTVKESDDETEEDCDFKLTMELSLKELQMTTDEKQLDEEAEMKEAIRRSLAETQPPTECSLNED